MMSKMKSEEQLGVSFGKGEGCNRSYSQLTGLEARRPWIVRCI